MSGQIARARGRAKAFLGTAGIWSGFALAAFAQPGQAPGTAPKQPDPLIQMMLAQPKIDIDSPVIATAFFDPPSVRPGEEAFYRVSMNALEESVQWPEELKGPAGLELRPGARGQVLQQLGAVLQPRTAINYRVKASTLGEFIIPEFVVKVTDRPPVTIPAARLEVVNSPTAPPPPRMALDIAQTNLFVGQAVKARILLPATPGGGIQMLAPNSAQFTGDGFVVDQGAIQQSVQTVPQAGENLPTYIHESILTPLMAGKIPVYCQGFVVNRGAGPIVIRSGTLSFSGMPYALLESPTIELQVRPLPREGQLPGFTGAVGSFILDPPALGTNVLPVGEPIRLSVTVRAKSGEASLARFVAPPAPQSREWQVFSAPGDNAPPQTVQARGFAVFNYTLIPLTETAQATPAVPFSAFDPIKGQYVDLTVPAVQVTVQPGRAPGDWQAILQPGPPGSEQEKEPELSGLAAAPGRSAASLTPMQKQSWFPLVQLAPAAALGGLWGWDRRRRYLEQHPDVLLRRRARRALHRQMRVLRQAARTGDARGYATAAVNALRIASAPHFPADDRALVGKDVLEVLNGASDSDRADDLVRHFFEVSDANRFATTRTDASALLAMQPQLERVLERLEAKL